MKHQRFSFLLVFIFANGLFHYTSSDFLSSSLFVREAFAQSCEEDPFCSTGPECDPNEEEDCEEDDDDDDECLGADCDCDPSLEECPQQIANVLAALESDEQDIEDCDPSVESCEEPEEECAAETSLSLAQSGAEPDEVFSVYLSTIFSKKKKCKEEDPYCELPDGCSPVVGSEKQAEWLQCFRENPLEICEAACNICDVFTTCALTGEEEQKIRDKCKDVEPKSAQIDCVSRYVRKFLLDDEDKVCRHYADCVEDMLSEFGHTTNFEGGGNGNAGHAWVETEDENGCTQIIDSYNRITYKCCP